MNKLDDIEPAAISAARRAKKIPTGGKIATANRLRDGVVVYLTEAGTWVPDIEQARVAHTPDDELALKAALDAGFRGNLIIDTQVIDALPARKTPARLREQIRAVGPTVRPDLARRTPF
jgi:sulfite reductase (NADPH) hemoprotein beta-component